MQVGSTVVIPPTGIEYCINAKARQNFKSNPFSFPVVMANGNQAIREGASYQMIVRSVQFANLIPNINSYNCNFSFQYNGTNYNSTFQIGNYSITSFINVFQTALQTANAGFTVTYDSNYKLLSIVIPAGVTSFSFNRGTVNTLIDDNYLFKQAPYDRFLDMIGFIDAARTNYVWSTSGSPLTITGDTPVNLYGTSFVDITIATNLGCVHMQPIARQILVRVPVLYDYGSSIYYQPTVSIAFRVDYETVQSMVMTCYDEWGCPIVDAPYNTPFQMQLLLTPLNQGND